MSVCKNRHPVRVKARFSGGFTMKARISAVLLHTADAKATATTSNPLKNVKRGVSLPSKTSFAICPWRRVLAQRTSNRGILTLLSANAGSLSTAAAREIKIDSPAGISAKPPAAKSSL